MKTIAQYIRPHYGIIAWTMVLKLVAAMMDLLIPSFLARIIDGALPSGDRRQVFFWGGMMAVCAVVSMVTNLSANRTAGRTSSNITRVLRRDLFEKISHLSARQLDQLTVPSAVSRLTSDTYNLNHLFNRTQRLGVRAPILLVGGLAITLAMDAALTLVLLLTLPFITLIVYTVTKKSVPLYMRQQGVLDRMVRTVQENVTGVRVIKALSKEDYEKERFDKVNLELADTERKAASVMAVTNPSTGFVLNIGLTMVVVAGAWLVNAGRSSTGNIIAFLNYFTIILYAMLGITRIFVMFSRGAASALRVEEVLALEEDLIVLPAGEKEDTPWHIEFRDVSFSYNKSVDNLSHINFALKRGETLGILGATGSGKTTLVYLLLRFYDVDSGQVLLDGEDIRTIPRERLHRMFGVAFQNDFIMGDTLRRNIDYFRGIPEARLLEAARDAQAGAFIAELPDGLDHVAAMRGNDLSGGQKQRILISRALAGQPDVLILDDSSSALDYRTDAALRKALSERYAGVTKVIVAQRISSIKGADHILVLDDGQAVGYGTHDELMRSCEAYRSIGETQMGLEGGGADE
ncbi:MAG: ABC transporter ATP-binding protein [Clostridiales bacterium]|nr:ABC transporter ATP-binding protein [Clostridiales bacterium]